jgi:hypothetical protein
MTMAGTRARFAAVLAGIVLATCVVTAQTGAAQNVRAVSTKPALAARGARNVKSMINGVAVDVDKTPLPSASVRLRNLQANAIEQVTTANQLGEFSFAILPDVPYVIELADQTGRIVAVGDVVIASAGEVAGAVIAIPSRLPALAGVFGETAGSVLSAATGMGLTVVDPALPELSPKK